MRKGWIDELGIDYGEKDEKQVIIAKHISDNSNDDKNESLVGALQKS